MMIYYCGDKFLSDTAATESEIHICIPMSIKDNHTQDSLELYDNLMNDLIRI